MGNIMIGASARVGAAGGGPLLKPLAELPNPSSVPASTTCIITNYGGNVATVVNGVWRFEFPFRTTWANRPAVGLVPAGTELQVTDYGNQKWVSDGTYWRPAQGRALIAQKHGTTSAPIAVLSATTAGVFTIPGGQIVVPAGMIIPQSRVSIMALMRKTGATSSCFFGVRLGIAGTFSDSLVGGLVSNTGNGAEVSINTSARIGDPISNTFLSMNTLGDGSTFAPTNALLVQTTNVDNSVDQFVSMIIANGNTSDTYNLLSCVVVLEA